MKYNKISIQKNFSKASASYDKFAHIQKTCAKQLVILLIKYFPEFYPNSILDLGTGTGYVPEILFNIFPNSKFTLNDISSDMIAITKNKLRNKKIKYIINDMEIQEFNFYDLIIANFSIQWAYDLKKIIKKFCEKSKVFAFTCLLHGTFDIWSNIFVESQLDSPVKEYPKSKELKEYIISLNLHSYFYKIREFTLRFKTANEFMKYLKNVGANYSKNKFLFSDLKKIIKNYTNTIYITYRVFFGMLNK